MKLVRLMTALCALSAFASLQPAQAADVICYNCPPQWADWATMLKQVKADLGYDIPFDNKNSGQALSQLKTLDILEKTARKRPTGWVTPIYGWSENTLEYLTEAKLAWCCDSLDATAPHWKETKAGKMLMIPWSDFVDNRALRASPRIYFDVYKDMFDYLHACEPGALINLGVHTHFGGRPAMTAIFRMILEYFRGHKDVWFARHDEVAKWIVEQKVTDTSYPSRFSR